MIKNLIKIFIYLLLTYTGTVYGYDIQAISASTWQTSARRGGAFEFQVVVQRNVPDFYITKVGFYLSKDAVYDSNDVFIDYSAIDLLNVSFPDTLQPRVWIPAQVEAGTWYLIARADYNNDLSETNENNNITSLQFTFTQPNVDLKVTALTAHRLTIPSGELLLTDVKEGNFGTDVANSHELGYYFSKDSIYDDADQLIESYIYIDNLAGGAFFADNSYIRIPKVTTYGTYYIIAVADYKRSVADINRSNNGKALKIHVEEAYDDVLIAAITSEDNNVVAGLPFSFEITEKNNGNTTFKYSEIACYLSKDASLSTDDTLLTLNQISELLPGMTASFSNKFTLSPKAVGGTYYLIAVADHKNWTNEHDETNNQQTYQINIIASDIDLGITAVSVEDTLVLNQSYLLVTATEYNRGSTAALDHRMGYYLSADSIWDAGDERLHDVFVASGTDAGSSKIYVEDVFFPVKTPVGKSYVLVVTDYNHEIQEINKGNNVKAIAITVSARKSDLYIYGPAQAQAITGNAVSTDIYISNIGNYESGGGLLRYALSKDTILSSDDPLVYLQSFNSIEANKSSGRISLSYNIPSDLPTGIYYLVAVVDPYDQIDEMDENNNQLITKLNVTAPNIDLNLNAGTIDAASYFLGAKLTLKYELRNVGTTSSKSSTTGFYLSNDAIYSTNDIYLGDFVHPALLGGAKDQVQTAFNIPSNISLGKYNLLLVADSKKLIAETNENNNVLAIALEVTSTLQVDLKIPSFSVTRSKVMRYSYVQPTVFIQNVGLGNTPRQQIDFYLSTDTTLHSSDVKLGTIDVGIMTGDSRKFLNPLLRIPGNTVSGTYYVIAQIDPLNALAENFENNNTRALKITVFTPEIDIWISSLSLPNNKLTPNNDLMPTVYLAYKGETYISKYSMGYYLSTDTIYQNGPDLFLGSRINDSILSAGVKELKATVRVPQQVSPGKYYLLIYADYKNEIEEINENNNISFKAIEVLKPGADLEPRAYDTNTITVRQGKQIKTSLWEKNIGNIPSGMHRVGYYWSLDNRWTSDDQLVSSQTIASINPQQDGGSYNNFTLPAKTLTGTYFLIKVVDDLQVIAESNEDNNYVVQKVILIGSEADMTVSSVSYPAFLLSPNNRSSTRMTVLNIGKDSSTTVELGYYLSKDPLYSTDDILLTSAEMRPFVPGIGGYTFDVDYLIPETVSPGSYYFIAVIDHQQVLEELSESNNEKALQVFIEEAVVDFEFVEPPSVTGSAYPGGSISLNSVIHNAGNSKSSDNVVGYFISTDSSYSIDDFPLGTSRPFYLHYNSQQEVRKDLQIPYLMPIGSYYIIAIVDFNSEIIETDETNNISFVKIDVEQVNSEFRITAGIDLVTSVSATINTSTADLVTVFINVKENNIGTINASTHQILLVLSSDSVYSSDDVVVSDTTINALAAGASFEKVIRKQFSSTDLFGSYHLLAVADPLKLINESSENNNLSQVKVSLSEYLVDLRVTEVQASKLRMPAGSTFELVTSTFNSGNSVAGFHELGYYISLDTLFSTDDVYLSASISNALLEPQHLQRLNASIKIPSHIASGNYYLLIVTDHRLQVAEWNEANNTKALKIAVEDTPLDLSSQISLQDISLVADSYLKPSLLLRGALVNAGTSLPLSNRVFLSRDSVLSETDTLLYEHILYNVTQDSMLQPTVYLPAYLPSGTYYLIYMVDYMGSVPENNEQNNLSSIKINLTTLTSSVTQSISEEISVFPNPSTGLFWIQKNTADDLNVQIFDLEDRLVYEENNVSGKLELASLPAGMYILKLQEPGKVVHQARLVLIK